MEYAQSGVRLVQNSKLKQVFKKEKIQWSTCQMTDKYALCLESSFLFSSAHLSGLSWNITALGQILMTSPSSSPYSYSPSYNYLNNLHSSSIALLITVITELSVQLFKVCLPICSESPVGGKDHVALLTCVFPGPNTVSGTQQRCSFQGHSGEYGDWHQATLKGPSAWVHLSLTFSFWPILK